jgi:hypothetical protein
MGGLAVLPAAQVSYLAENAAVTLDLIDGVLCPLCYRPVAGRAHALLDDTLAVCTAALLDNDFPRDEDTGEPLLLQLPHRGDEWLFGVSCIHLMRVSRRQGEPRFYTFAERWPIGAALMLEKNPIREVEEHYRPLGLMERRAGLTWRIAEQGADGYTGYPREAVRVLMSEELDQPAVDRKIEAWRRWRLWTMGVET